MSGFPYKPKSVCAIGQGCLRCSTRRVISKEFAGDFPNDARYKLVDLHRRRARNEALQDPLDDDQPLFTTVDHEASEARHDLEKLLNLLPDRHHLPILCVKIEGLSVTDAARRTGMSESAVKVGIHRGLKALAERLRSVV